MKNVIDDTLPVGYHVIRNKILYLSPLENSDGVAGDRLQTWPWKSSSQYTLM